MEKMILKAGAVNHLTDARYFAARGVDWLGIPLGGGDPAATVDLLTAKAFIEWVDGVRIVGEFPFSTASEILSVHRQLWFDAVQVGMFTPPEEIRRLEGLTVLQEVVPPSEEGLAWLEKFLSEQAPAPDYYLIDFNKAGRSWDLGDHPIGSEADILREICQSYRVILSLDLHPGNLAEVLSSVRPYGLQLQGGEEEKTGFKSFDELDELLDMLDR
jgi:phosphoribosylanthranilate isomerase